MARVLEAVEADHVAELLLERACQFSRQGGHRGARQAACQTARDCSLARRKTKRETTTTAEMHGEFGSDTFVSPSMRAGAQRQRALRAGGGRAARRAADAAEVGLRGIHVRHVRALQRPGERLPRLGADLEVLADLTDRCQQQPSGALSAAQRSCQARSTAQRVPRGHPCARRGRGRGGGGGGCGEGALLTLRAQMQPRESTWPSKASCSSRMPCSKFWM